MPYEFINHRPEKFESWLITKEVEIKKLKVK